MESLHIRELGILRDSTFDTTKPLILLAGPNRTGKTLVSYLMYGLSEFSHMVVDDRVEDQISTLITGIKNADLSAPIITEAFENPERFFEMLFFAMRPNKIKLFNLITEEFNIDYEALFKIIGKGEKINSEYRIKNKNYSGTILVHNISKDSANVKDIAQEFRVIFANSQRSKCFFLPCERLFATMVGSDLVRAEYKNYRNSQIDLPRQIKQSMIMNSNPRYAQPIMDYLIFIDDLEYVTKVQNDKFISIADFLNLKLMGGQVHWKADQRRLIFNEYRTNKEIPFHLSASGIKSLTGLELYLRHQCVGDGTDILFFDEPELNLHPKAQRVVARVIARMINAGIKVVVSTHSDYIISQLSNLVVLGTAYQKDSEKVMRWVKEHGLDYEREDFLLPEQVAPYHFDFVESGEYAQATLIETSEKGFFFPSMDEVIFDLSNEINRLYAELIES